VGDNRTVMVSTRVLAVDGYVLNFSRRAGRRLHGGGAGVNFVGVGATGGKGRGPNGIKSLAVGIANTTEE
jgi:hypothetical protein